MKSLYPLLVLVLLAGCATPAGTEPLAQYYEEYRGAQSEWPTAAASFVTDRYGVVFYHGLPSFAYTIVGRYDRPNLPLDKLARSSQTHGVNVVCLSVESLLALHQDKSTATVLAAGHYAQAVNQPGDIYLAPHTSTYAYLIKPKNPADFTPPTSSVFELTNVDMVASPRRSKN